MQPPTRVCCWCVACCRSSYNKRTGQSVSLAAILEAGPSRGADRYVHRAKPAPGEAAASGGEAAPRLELVGDVAGACTPLPQ